MSALSSLTVVACAVCFQADGSGTTTGIRFAVATLVLITGSVLTGFVVYLRGTGLFSTDLADSVPGVGIAKAESERLPETPGTEVAKSVENRPVPLCR